jgi:hypothetical protein
MQAKQRVLFNKMRSYRHVDVRDNKASLEAIRTSDEWRPANQEVAAAVSPEVL